jgi:hypothetical protein
LSPSPSLSHSQKFPFYFPSFSFSLPLSHYQKLSLNPPSPPPFHYISSLSLSPTYNISLPPLSLYPSLFVFLSNHLTLSKNLSLSPFSIYLLHLTLTLSLSLYPHPSLPLLPPFSLFLYVNPLPSPPPSSLYFSLYPPSMSPSPLFSHSLFVFISPPLTLSFILSLHAPSLNCKEINGLELDISILIPRTKYNNT